MISNTSASLVTLIGKANKMILLSTNLDSAIQDYPIDLAFRRFTRNTTEEQSQSQLSSNRANPAAKSSENNFPNGGLHAWLQVLGAFFLVFDSW